MLAAGLLCGATASAQNVAPTISGTPSTVAKPGQPYQFKPTASDPNGDRLTFSASGLPHWAQLDKRTGQVSGKPSKRHLNRSYAISLYVSDGKLAAMLPRFTLTVVASSPPTISGAPATAVVEGELYGFVPVASDADGDALRFGIANKPDWATFSASSGLLSGIPPVGAAGTYSNISIAVSDGTSSRSLAPFSITVTGKGNSAPAIWGVPATSVNSGETYSFRPSASDPDGQPLQFRVQGLPGWGRFDTATGTLSGTPSWSDAGKYSSIVISATDGQATSSLAPFSITVAASNTPPQISGTPPDSVAAGQPYAFAPAASDPEGQPLTFSIANKPAWAAFDSTTGRLSGTPDGTLAGTYSNIVISVSDGQYASSLPAFALTVMPVVKGSATLSWDPPTTNVDGTPLTDLAGYRIAYGQAADSLSQTLTIASGAITSAVVEGLAPGTWYFAIKAYTAANVESDLSTIGQKTIL